VGTSGRSWSAGQLNVTLWWQQIVKQIAYCPWQTVSIIMSAEVQTCLYYGWCTERTACFFVRNVFIDDLESTALNIGIFKCFSLYFFEARVLSHGQAHSTNQVGIHKTEAPACFMFQLLQKPTAFLLPLMAATCSPQFMVELITTPKGLYDIRVYLWGQALQSKILRTPPVRWCIRRRWT